MCSHTTFRPDLSRSSGLAPRTELNGRREVRLAGPPQGTPGTASAAQRWSHDVA